MQRPPDRPEQDNKKDKKAAKKPPLRPIEVKKLREDRKLTQEKLAGDIGVDVRTIRNYESGQSQPKGYRLQKLYNYFGIDKEETLPSDTPQPSDTGQDLTDIPAPPIPQPYDLLDIFDQDDLPRNYIFSGKDGEDELIFIKASELCHAALYSTTGEEKTTLERGIEAQLLHAGYTVIHADLKFALVTENGTDYKPLAKRILDQKPIEIEQGHKVQCLLIEEDDIVQLLHYLVKEIDERRNMRREGKKDLPYPPYYIFLGDLRALIRTHTEITTNIRRIIDLGRELQINLFTPIQNLFTSTTQLSGDSHIDFQTVYFFGGNEHLGAQLLGMQQKDLTDYLHTNNITLGKGLGIMRNNFELPSASLVQIGFASNEAIYSLLGRADDFTLPPDGGSGEPNLPDNQQPPPLLTDQKKITRRTLLGLAAAGTVTLLSYLAFHTLQLPKPGTTEQSTPLPTTQPTTLAGPQNITIGKWQVTGAMARPRYLHSATLLTQGKTNGKVLVAGGLSNATTLIDTTELFDPQTNSWQPTTVLNQARVRAILVTLRTGEAIIAGGTDAGVLLDFDSTELFNPDTEVWKYVAPLNTPRRSTTATLLQDGYHVLVASGAKGRPTSDQFLDSAEIYDAKANIWRFTDNKLTTKRQEANSVLLNDGRVMVAGGEGLEHFTPTVELFSPNNKGTGTWSLGKSMTSGWKGATMTVLPPPDNRVLVIGGGPNGYANPIVRIYDPITNTWTEGKKMNIARSSHTASLLPNYHVLIAGGAASKETEIYDPKHDRWYAGPPLNTPRNAHIAITLNDNNILIIGGKDAATDAILSSCERLPVTIIR